MELQLRFGKGQIEKISDELLHIPGATQKATVSAINKTLPGMRTDTARAVAKVFYIKNRVVKDTLTIKKASKNRIEGAVRSDGAAIPLIKFRTAPRAVSKRRPKGGVMVRVKRGAGQRIPHSFIAQMRSGHLGVFWKRHRQKRLPIDERFGPAVPSMLKDTGAQETIQAQTDARLVKNVDHEIYRIVRGYGK